MSKFYVEKNSFCTKIYIGTDGNGKPKYKKLKAQTEKELEKKVREYKNAIDSGKEIPTDITASALCDILKAEFNGGFSYSGVTGSNITWGTNGKVQKDAVKYIVKAANAQ